ncbi:MAG: transposase [Pseudomonadota bacterium]
MRRFQVAGVPQLVSQRGHNRLPCFSDGADFSRFNEVLRSSAEKYGCDIQAHLLLPDAYWAVLMPTEKHSISKTLQLTGRLFVQYTNKKYRREGTLWAERYRACPIEPTATYLASINRYLDVLPVNRGYGASGKWPWMASSLPMVGTKGLPSGEIETIDRALQSGAAYGSPEFVLDLEKQTGQRAVARRRGRPSVSPIG